MREYEDYIRQEEENNYAACIAAAEHAGLTAAQAVECEYGEYKCEHCPWAAEPHKCRHCGTKLKFSYWHITENDPMDGYDAYYCDICDKWASEKCSDETCEFCAARPLRPSDVLKERVKDEVTTLFEV